MAIESMYTSWCPQVSKRQDNQEMDESWSTQLSDAHSYMLHVMLGSYETSHLFTHVACYN